MHAAAGDSWGLADLLSAETAPSTRVCVLTHITPSEIRAVLVLILQRKKLRLQEAQIAQNHQKLVSEQQSQAVPLGKLTRRAGST